MDNIKICINENRYKVSGLNSCASEESGRRRTLRKVSDASGSLNAGKPKRQLAIISLSTMSVLQAVS
jgi:hypothetical protein